MLWKLLQLLVFIAVTFTGLYYEWTPSGLALSITAALAALAATVFVDHTMRSASWVVLKLRPILSEQRQQDRLPPRR